jgi:hypothetical protein
MLILGLLCGAQTWGAGGPDTARMLSGLESVAVQSGQHANLPPHLSLLLGISHTEASVAVHQLGFKNGQAIKTLNVCADEHNNVVLMSAGADQRIAAYLMSPQGTLRKAFVYRVGGDTRELRLAEAQAGFAQERELWIERAPALGVKP